MYNKSIFIFTRDFRTIDNLGLNACATKSKKIIPIFVFTPEQTKNNSYFSENAYSFMYHAICNEISSICNFYHGKHADIIDKLLKSDNNISAVYMNFETTPYGRERADAIRRVCDTNNCDFYEYPDFNLFSVPMECGEDKYTIEKPYKVYGAYKKKCGRNFKKPSTKRISKSKFITMNTNIDKARKPKPQLPHFPATRRTALARLRNYDAKDYAENRDDPHEDATTKLSPYIKFGLISIREVAKSAKGTLFDELIWRDFFSQASYYFPKSLEGGRYRKPRIKWDNPQYEKQKIRDGDTGCPIIDESLRQLYECGWVHNRLRMVFATHLHEQDIDWKWGEKLYAQNLVDYDVSSNHWNWAHHSVQGLNPQFSIRKMKVSTQQKKYKY